MLHPRFLSFSQFIKNRFLGAFYNKKNALTGLKTQLKSNPEPRILFVCLGNICRSAYAESYYKSIKCNNLIIKSAGISTSNGKAADESAIREASRRNISLNEHKTQKLTAELIEDYDLIFCMEPYQIEHVKKLNPSKQKLILPLGIFAEGTLYNPIIKDPYGKDENAFMQCFDTIESGCKFINSIIKKELNL